MAIVRKDKLVGGYHGNLESVIVYNNAGTSTVEITNGMFVYVEGLIGGGERETKKARLASVGDRAKDVLFIHSPEIMYDERKDKLSDFRIKAGKVTRAYRLYDGDIVSLTIDLFQGAVAVNDKLIVMSNGKIGKPDLVATPNALTEAKVVFEVIENAGFELDATMGAFAVQIHRN